MLQEIKHIESQADAQRICDIILDSLNRGEVLFNPFPGRILKRQDGTIIFMGRQLRSEEAAGQIASYIWQNRTRVNKQIRKWQLAGGGRFLNCGC